MLERVWLCVGSGVLVNERGCAWVIETMVTSCLITLTDHWGGSEACGPTSMCQNKLQPVWEGKLWTNNSAAWTEIWHCWLCNECLSAQSWTLVKWDYWSSVKRTQRHSTHVYYVIVGNILPTGSYCEHGRAQSRLVQRVLVITSHTDRGC